MNQPSFGELYVEAAQHCLHITETTNLRPVLDDAKKRGKRRDPKTHHIVVHPETPWHSDALEASELIPGAEECRSRFYELMMHTFEKERDVLVWQYPGAGAHMEFPYTPQAVVPTIDPDVVGGSIQGTIDADCVELALEKMQGIHPLDRFRISGAALGRCPTQTAFQLHALTKWKLFIPPGVVGSPERQYSNVLREAMLRLRGIQRRVVFDILHNTFFDNEVDETTKILAKYATIIPDPLELT